LLLYVLQKEQIQPKWYLSTNFDYRVPFSTAFLGKNKIAIKAK